MLVICFNDCCSYNLAFISCLILSDNSFFQLKPGKAINKQNIYIFLKLMWNSFLVPCEINSCFSARIHISLEEGFTPTDLSRLPFCPPFPVSAASAVCVLWLHDFSSLILVFLHWFLLCSDYLLSKKNHQEKAFHPENIPYFSLWLFPVSSFHFFFNKEISSSKGSQWCWYWYCPIQTWNPPNLA